MANRLANEQSPYLLQHKDNPVDWYPWGEEAFAKARAEEKPIFLSIGYSTCHWCHVMEHESFETERGRSVEARLRLDQGRPRGASDVDDIYMQAVQTMTGQGGWPLSLFLTPDRRPFYGGTYFPPAARWGKPGFLQLVEAIANGWKTRREELESSAGQMLEHLRAGAAVATEAGEPRPELLETAVRSLSRQFDPVEGGFGGAPKFPPSMRLEPWIRRWLATGDPETRAMTEKTLEKMAAGGMYDQVGGGFHRYSVDAHWLVPHFEKMLYDNAMLARVYLIAHRAFGAADYARVARETLDYLLREMTPEAGGFFAAQDADSGGEEGTFYVWNPESLAAAVGAEAAPVVAARFGVTPQGNFEGRETVLPVAASIPELAGRFHKTGAEVEAILETARARMYEERAKRVWPATDDKLLTDWTALAISGFALAGRVLSEPRYEHAARAAADRILARCVREGRLLHREKAGARRHPRIRNGLAFFTRRCSTSTRRLSSRGTSPSLCVSSRSSRRTSGAAAGYFLAAASHDGLILRPKESYDGRPSSNSVAAMNLLRLHSFTGEDRYRLRAGEVLSAFSALFERAPAAFPRLLCALDFSAASPREIVLSGQPGRDDFEALRRAAFASRGMNRVLAHADSAQTVPQLAALAEGRASREGKAAAYVCESFACRAPILDPGELRAALDG
jgi:uncharacterized protein YyaL (SSP411 family)